MILAAGRGRRMRPWTLRRPKPLLQVAGKPLLQHQVEQLARAGVRRLVVNCAHLGEQVEAFLGDGSRFGVHVQYSREGQAPLGTGGGVRRALGLLGPDPFLLISADAWHDYPLSRLRRLPPGSDARLVLVPNPPHHPEGDFSFTESPEEDIFQSLAPPRPSIPYDSEAKTHPGPRFTYTGLALCRPRLFRTRPPGSFDLAPLLHEAAAAGRLEGTLHSGQWLDAGTPQRLAALRRRLCGTRLQP